VVADGVGAGEVDAVVALGLAGPVGLGFDALAVVGALVRADVDLGDGDAAGGEELDDAGVDGIGLGAGDEAFGDAALVGDDEEEEVLAQGAEGGEGVWIQDRVRRVGEVAAVFDESAVAIQEESGFHRLSSSV